MGVKYNSNEAKKSLLLKRKQQQSKRRIQIIKNYQKNLNQHRNVNIIPKSSKIIPNLMNNIDTETSVEKAMEYLKRTIINDCIDSEQELHSANVCVVCDRFIIGIESIELISEDILLRNKERLGIYIYLKLKRK